METLLNISHLGRRLGSGVKFEKGIDDVTHSELLAVRDDYSILLSGYVYKTQNSECEFQRPAMWVQMCLKKPILRTDLTKPITHNGETFVPIVELAKIADCHWKYDPELKEVVETIEDGCRIITVNWFKAQSFEFSYEIENLSSDEIKAKNDPFTMVIRGKDDYGNYPVMNPLRVIEKLIAWNFRIDEPEGSYIIAEELPVNPYEV